MARTVVYPVVMRNGGTPPAGGEAGGDSVPERLVKYVPAETLAFFVPAAAGLGADREGLLIAVIVAGLVGTIGYLWVAAQREDEDKRPMTHFYVLAGLAFLCWALGTSGSVSSLVDLDATAAGVILGLAVFLIPLVDEVLVHVKSR